MVKTARKTKSVTHKESKETGNEIQEKGINFIDPQDIEGSEIGGKLHDKSSARSMSRVISVVDPVTRKEAEIAQWYYTNKNFIDQGIRLFDSRNSQIIARNDVKGTVTFLVSGGQRMEVWYTPIGIFQPNAREPFWVWSRSGSSVGNIPVFAGNIANFDQKLLRLGNVYGIHNSDMLLLGPTNLDVGANLETILASCYYALNPIAQFTMGFSDQLAQQIGMPQDLWGSTEYFLITKMRQM